MAFESEVDDQVKQRMTGADEGGQRLPGGATSDFSKAMRS